MPKDDYNSCISNAMPRRYKLVRISEHPDIAYQSELGNNESFKQVLKRINGKRADKANL